MPNGFLLKGNLTTPPFIGRAIGTDEHVRCSVFAAFFTTFNTTTPAAKRAGVVVFFLFRIPSDTIFCPGPGRRFFKKWFGQPYNRQAYPVRQFSNEPISALAANAQWKTRTEKHWQTTTGGKARVKKLPRLPPWRRQNQRSFSRKICRPYPFEGFDGLTSILLGKVRGFSRRIS